MLFSLEQVGEGCVCFSLGQVLGLLCNPAESTQKASFLSRGAPFGRCGIYAKNKQPFQHGVPRTLGKAML